MSTELDYHPNGEAGLRWWEESEDSEDAEPAGSWSPPRTVDILRNVHISRSTHIKSPFHHRRYPYQFKTQEYFTYTSEAETSSQDAGPASNGPSKAGEPAPDPRHMNVELSPVRPNRASYRELFREKSLRQRIYDGEVRAQPQPLQVFFYDDYVEYSVARDYCRLFRRPFDVPRRDWGGAHFHFGEKLPDRRAQEEERAQIQKRESIRSVEREEEGARVSEADALIMSTAFLDTFKRNELLNGEIPSLFEGSSRVVRQRPRKDRWVSFHNLRNYGLMIDSVTKCPLIHVQLQSALQEGWNPQIRSTVLEQSEEPSAQRPDPYAVSEEQLARANAALAERRRKAEDPLPDMTKLFKSRSYGVNENCYTIGGGRYRV